MLSGRSITADPRAAAPFLALALVLVAAMAEAAPRCEGGAPLALLGFDTARGEILFVLVGTSGGEALVTLRLDPLRARAIPLAGMEPRFAGSSGPGPIFALRRCGETCVLAERFRDGAWEIFGPTLRIAEQANVSTTYDREGAAWIITHEPGPSGWLTARAFRLESGTWRERGSLSITSPNALGVAPAAGQPDAVLSGTGLFSANAAPKTWIEGLPALPPGKGGSLVPIDANGVAFLASDGAIYLSPDRGATWKGTRYKPWGTERTELWAYGSDYALDLPLGTLGPPLPLAWFDRRGGREGRIYLTALAPNGEWSLTGELAAEVEADSGETTELIHLLHKDGGAWVLISDCIEVRGVPGVAVRTYTPAGPTAPAFVAFE